MSRRLLSLSLALCLSVLAACTDSGDDVDASGTLLTTSSSSTKVTAAEKGSDSGSTAKKSKKKKAASLRSRSSASSAASSSSAEPSDTTASPTTNAEPTPSSAAPVAGPLSTTPLTAPPKAGAQAGGDPTGIYRGVLGKLDLDEILAQPIVNPPDPVAEVGPLTGLLGAVPDRPAIVVKIDNTSKARPQAGLNAADIVIEEEVEWGITRLAAVFHTNSQAVGPVRSGRTTDIAILNAFINPVLVYSGANEVTDSLLRNQVQVTNRGASAVGGAYWRQPGRSAPSNLFTDLGSHWSAASGPSPLPIFAYRPAGHGSVGNPVNSFSVAYQSTKVGWSWDGSAWRRVQNGSAHVDSNGLQAGATNVVVVETERVDTGMVDSAGSVVPEFVWVGQGKAAVFTDGKRIDGTWTRPSLASRPTFTTGDGQVIGFGPGRTWVEIVDRMDQQLG